MFWGCLVPPDPRPEPNPPFPPAVDFSSLRPLEPRVRIRLRPPCRPFRVEVNDIVDEDSRALRARWVVNNNLDGTRLLASETLPPLDPGTPQRSSWRLDVEADLDVDGTGLEPGDAPVLSFFVTDAPAFSEEPPDAGPFFDEVRDLGRIPEGAGAVVEVRWTFVFGPNEGSGTCPP